MIQARLLYGYATVADTVDPFGYDAAGRGLELATELGDDRLRSLFLALVAVGKFFTDFEEAWELAAEGRRLAEGTLDEAVAYVRRTRGARGRPSSGWAGLAPWANVAAHDRDGNRDVGQVLGGPSALLVIAQPRCGGTEGSVLHGTKTRREWSQ